MTHRTDTAQALAGSTTLLAAALDAAANGWAVLPCHPTGPRAKAPVAQLVPHGHLDATRDPATIIRWWSSWPTAMIGAAVPASLMVLDVDPRNGGSLLTLEAALGALPTTLSVISGRGDGGVHLYYHRPAVTLRATGLPAGVDLKAAGYCILPPSPHPATGRTYRWDHAPVASLSAMAVSVLRPPPPKPQMLRQNRQNPSRLASEGLVRKVAEASDGQRNALTYWAALKVLEGDYGPELLEAIARAAIGAGLPEREVTATIGSAHTAHGRQR